MVDHPRDRYGDEGGRAEKGENGKKDDYYEPYQGKPQEPYLVPVVRYPEEDLDHPRVDVVLYPERSGVEYEQDAGKKQQVVDV